MAAMPPYHEGLLAPWNNKPKPTPRKVAFAMVFYQSSIKLINIWYIIAFCLLRDRIMLLYSSDLFQIQDTLESCSSM